MFYIENEKKAGDAMQENKAWQMELDEYIRQGEPDRAEKSEAWKTAIGLQDVDGLKTSAYLLDTAKEHIEGNIDIATAQKRIESYYKQSNAHKDIEENTKEADIVSARIAAILGEKTFQFSPVALKEIHKRLFTGVFAHAGQFRDYNITKSEWILKGHTVLYASADSIQAALDYDFQTEKAFDYAGLSAQEAIHHIARFAADIWQIHPFCEGNTRTTAVFIIKYLKTFGFSAGNDAFAENSWYFRNALVRANYNDVKNGITATTKYLELFFENLLLGKHHVLKNRYLHIDFQSASQSASQDDQKCKNCTLEELAILQAIADDPGITQKMLAKKIGKSERTVKTKTVAMQQRGLIERVNGKRNGHWRLLVEL